MGPVGERKSPQSEFMFHNLASLRICLNIKAACSVHIVLTLSIFRVGSVSFGGDRRYYVDIVCLLLGWVHMFFGAEFFSMGVKTAGASTFSKEKSLPLPIGSMHGTFTHIWLIF